MNRSLVMALIVIVVLALAATAVVAVQPQILPASRSGAAAVPVDTGPAASTPALFAPRTAQPAGGAGAAQPGPGSDVPLTAMLNYEIQDGQGQSIGTLDNLLLDMAGGRVSYALVAFGKGVQSSDRLYPVPLNALKVDPAKRALILNAGAQVIARAPSITRQDLANGARLPLAGDVRPFWGTGSTETQAGTQPGLPATGTPPVPPGTPVPNLAAAPLPPGPQVLAAQLIGFEVWTDQNGQRGQRLASVQDLVVDVMGDNVPYVVLAAGNATSPGKKLLPVPFGALRYSAASKAFLLSADARRMEQAPGFAQDQWPDLSHPGWDAPFARYWPAR